MLPVEVIKKDLRFSDRDHCMKFLTEKGVVFNADQSKVDCKLSTAPVQAS